MKFLFAWRYFKAKKSTNAINVIAWVSVTAIVIGTASLIIVLSVFNGLEDLVKSLYSAFYTDIKISPSNGKFITLSANQLQQLNGAAPIRGYSLVIEDKALLQYQALQPVILKGVDTNYTHITGVSKNIIKGKFDLGSVEQPGIVMGAGIENALGIESDRSVLPLTVYLFKKASAASTDPMESVSTGNIAATGAFIIQQDFDNKYAITNLGFMQQMLGLSPNEYTGVEISLKDPQQTDMFAASLKKMFGQGYLVQTRYEQNQNLYSVMRVEKWVIYCVLTLILIVAAFNMVGALTMLVLEKQKDIQILKALGANNNYIQKIFLNEGMLLALLGGATGIIFAVVICWMQVRYKLVPLQGESFLIDYYPVKLVPTDFLLVLTTIFIVAILASWVPSRKAALEPIELR